MVLWSSIFQCLQHYYTPKMTKVGKQGIKTDTLCHLCKHTNQTPTLVPSKCTVCFHCVYKSCTTGAEPKGQSEDSSVITHTLSLTHTHTLYRDGTLLKMTNLNVINKVCRKHLISTSTSTLFI